MMSRFLTTGFLALPLLAALALPAQTGFAAEAAWAPPVPEPAWDAVTPEATALLQTLIRQRSVNPPGDELGAANLLAEKIRGEGLEATVVESAPGRGNVMATLKGDGSAKPIVLLCHLDVVPVEIAGWTEDPFAGVIKEEAIWGRGAIDDKGMCTANLMAFLAIHRQKVPLRRNVIFLATADEEVGQQGVDFMIQKFPTELSAEFVINEGGIGLTGAVVKGQVLWAVSAAEKGASKIRLTAISKPGHGSTPRPNQAPDRLIQALAHLSTLEPELQLHDYAREMLRRIGRTQKGAVGFLMRHPDAFAGLLAKVMSKNPPSRATISNTANLTILKAGEKINVVPGRADAWLDVRVLPGSTHAQVRDRLQKELQPYGIEVAIETEIGPSGSPFDTELFRALERHLPENTPGAVVAPIVSTGYTDSRPFREKGAVAYGIVPFLVSDAEFEGMHGHNERVKVSELGLGTKRIYRTVVEVAVKK